MGELAQENVFYQFLKSSEGPAGSTAGNFRNEVPGKVFDPQDDWVVGISSISFPDSIYNIHGKEMRKVTVGNNLSEVNFLLPSGRYSPEGFVSVMNKILERQVMATKYDIVHQRGMMSPLDSKHSNFIKIKFDVGETDHSSSPVFKSEEEKLAMQEVFDAETLKEEHEWTNSDVEMRDVIPGEATTATLLNPSPEQNQEFKDLLIAYCTAGRHGQVLNFRMVDTNVNNDAYQGDREILRTVNDWSINEFTNFMIYHSKTLNAEFPVRNIQEFMRTSKIRFFYDSMYHKIGVKTVFQNNPFGDYVIIHDAQLRDMLGMNNYDAEKLQNNSPDGWLARKGVRRFKFVANFEIELTNIFVYTNIVVESGIANQKAQISEIISVPKVDPRKKAQLSFQFPIPNYKKVDRTLVNVIEIFLADYRGREIKFHDWGVTLVCLKFKKIKSATSILEKIYFLIKNFYNRIFAK